MSHKTYSKYKQSCVKWLGDIPEHWDLKKLKYISSIQFSNVDKHSHEDEIPVRLCNYVDVYYHEFINSDIELMEATATPAEIAKFTLKQGDVIITKDSEDWNDIAVPAYVSSDLPNVLCGYHLAQIRPNSCHLDGRFLFRAFCSRGINDQYRVEATGITRYGLGKYWLDNGIFPVPPLDEQRAIADFLDRKTNGIDSLLSKIELLAGKITDTATSYLNEYRVSLITAAVTGKIDVRNEAK